MHQPFCTCPSCRRADELSWSDTEYSGSSETYRALILQRPFTEEEEIALAEELLGISSEEELDYFLGKLFKKAWKGIKKVGRAVGKFVKPLGRVLKRVAKKALPFVGGALGSFIPIPGVGTAIGSAVGGALSKALETELAGLPDDEVQFEMARRFVRLAGAAAQQAAAESPDSHPEEVAEVALVRAARKHLPQFPIAPTSSGRWVRRGGNVMLLGA